MARRTSRANSRELKIIKTYLLARDGNFCKICNIEFPAEKLILDHKDNNHRNWSDENLQLACQSCNIKKDPPYWKIKDVDNVRVRVCVENEPRPQSAEMAKNMKSEPLFKCWLKREMTKKLRMDLEDVIDSGAQFADISIDTVRGRYLKKLVSRLGPYTIVVELGVKILVWKEDCFPFNDHIKKWMGQ